ncbi:hypothetical protein [Flexivirga oryzae]|uniref:Uncharacterized protein n=1 Tax=Flexivirga oryzae TaxID=1794944 RepID=A0A839N5X5_9MICO|nr:hypothetical protein [Flexivirga oryzae]MBB2893150.1 hypothetical protein [Flexivirga oryzae]
MTDEPFELAEAEAVAIAEVATAFAAVLPPERRGPYDGLVEAASAGSVDPEQLPELERVCVLALETGRARQLGKAETERLVNAVYRRTPGGRALTAEASDVNKVLAGLAGKSLQTARITCRMPGRYLLDLVVDGIDVSISLEPEGLEVRSLQTG